MLPSETHILSPEAVAFLEKLHRRFRERRLELLAAREARQQRIHRGEMPHFLPETEEIRKDLSWKVAPIPKDLKKRTVEITGPVSRKMMINALNSGADVFMADFEDANSPTWENVIEGQQNCFDAVRKSISLKTAEKEYTLAEKTATLLVRPRGWHLIEKHFQVDGQEVSASLFDFGLYFFHNAQELIKRGSGPYFYLPKLENRLEARLWNDVFNFAQDELGIKRGTIRATVLIETILAAFEMEEILFELRDHSSGLNAGRWDYIFSIVKTFRRDPNFALPDRVQITMNVPFMSAYSNLLVRTCHKRGAQAIGGMAAFIPNRRDPEVTKQALEKVTADKEREARAGFDGTWVAHPDLVEIARAAFEKKYAPEKESEIKPEDLLTFRIEGGKVTDQGVRLNLSVALRYLASWLSGVGAAALDNLMEDAATAEISRAQLWQWIRAGVKTTGGEKVTKEYVEKRLKEERSKIKEPFDAKALQKAEEILSALIFDETFIPFLTLKAYPYL